MVPFIDVVTRLFFIKYVSEVEKTNLLNVISTLPSVKVSG